MASICLDQRVFHLALPERLLKLTCALSVHLVMGLMFGSEAAFPRQIRFVTRVTLR